MEKFPERYKLPKLTQEEIKNKNRWIEKKKNRRIERKSVIQKLSIIRSPESGDFTD